MVQDVAAWWGDHNGYRIRCRYGTGVVTEDFLAVGSRGCCVVGQLHAGLESDRHVVKRFVDQRKIVGRLCHPNLAALHEIGHRRGRHYAVSEYVHGNPLRALIWPHNHRYHPLPLDCVLTIVAGVAAGLEFAHGQRVPRKRPLGIVHHGLSPANVTVSYEGNIKIVNFGIEQAVKENRWCKAPPEVAKEVEDRYCYMSPEECRGQIADHRSDLFALGVMMWELLTGTRLYRRPTGVDTLWAIVHEPARPPSAWRPDLPPEIDEIALGLLARSPTERFQSAAEVVASIRRAAADSGATLSPAVLTEVLRKGMAQELEPYR